jgi:hypothetical protein
MRRGGIGPTNEIRLNESVCRQADLANRNPDERLLILRIMVGVSLIDLCSLF